MRARRSHRLDRLARIHDAEIQPFWSERFGRLLLRDARFPPGAMILDAATGTGQVALEALELLGDSGRVVAIEHVPALLDVARAKAGPLVGKRLFLRSDAAQPRLPFADQAFDAALWSLALEPVAPILEEDGGADELPARVRELARVTREGGGVRVALPLAGTFAEFLELFAAAMASFGREAALEQLARYQAAQPTAESLRAALAGAGLVEVTVVEEVYQLEFASSRAFFFAPLVELGPLPGWRAIAGDGEPMQQLFWRVRDAIDDLVEQQPFRVTVRAACATGRRPLEGEAGARPVTLSLLPGGVGRAARAPSSVDGSEGAIRIDTAELAILDSTHDGFPAAAPGGAGQRGAPRPGLPALVTADGMAEADDEGDDGGAAAIFEPQGPGLGRHRGPSAGAR